MKMKAQRLSDPDDLFEEERAWCDGRCEGTVAVHGDPENEVRHDCANQPSLMIARALTKLRSRMIEDKLAGGIDLRRSSLFGGD